MPTPPSARLALTRRLHPDAAHLYHLAQPNGLAPFETAKAAFNLITDVDARMQAQSHWTHWYRSRQRLPTPTALCDWIDFFLNADVGRHGDAAADAVFGLSEHFRKLVDHTYDLADRLADDMKLVGKPHRPPPGKLTLDAARYWMEQVKTWARDHCTRTDHAPGGDGGPQREKPPVGRLTMAEVREKYPDLGGKQIDAVRSRLNRWRQSGDNETCCRRDANAVLNREEWSYPADVVDQFATAVRERPRTSAKGT